MAGTRRKPEALRSHRRFGAGAMRAFGHRPRAEGVRRGVRQAGGFPVELPATSVGEPMTEPTGTRHRNLLTMETEELLRSQPIHGAVPMGGCDKTAPAP